MGKDGLHASIPASAGRIQQMHLEAEPTVAEQGNIHNTQCDRRRD